MMCRSGFVRKLTAVLLSLMVVALYCVDITGSVYAGGPAVTYKDSATGLTYLLDTAEHTAALNDIDPSVTTVNVPESITVPDGEDGAGTYAVTEVCPHKDGGGSGPFAYPAVQTFTTAGTVRTVKNISLQNVSSIVFSEGIEAIENVRFGPDSGADFDGSMEIRGNTLRTLWNVRFNNTKSLDLPDGVTDITGTFRAAQVKEITVPGSVSTFSGTFDRCSNLEKIVFSEGVAEIAGNSSIATKCPNLKEIVLPDTLSMISRGGAFRNLTKLNTIGIPAGAKLASGTGSLFAGDTGLESIKLPDGFLQDGRVPAAMFMGCSSLKSVDLGSVVTGVGSAAFMRCGSLSSIKGLYDQLSEIGQDSFSGTKSLAREFDLSEVGSIPNNAFKDSGVTGVTFSENLTSIGNSAFSGSRLQKVDIPDSVKSIGNSAFSGCADLAAVKIGNGVEELTGGQFANCANLKTVEIGSGISKIGDSAFDGTAVESAVIHSEPSKVDVNSIGPVLKKDIKFEPYPGGGSSDEPEYSGESDTTVSVGDPETLQEKINNAKDGEVTAIQLTKGITAAETIEIPAGKNIVIESKDPSKIQVIRKKEDDGKSLFKVKAGGTLTLKNVFADGRNGTDGNQVTQAGGSGFIDVEGTFVMEDGTAVSHLHLKDNDSGAVKVSGDKAEFTLSGGRISDISRTEKSIGSGTGSVLLSSGSHMTMTGGKITENRCLGSSDGNTQNSSPGVFITGGSKLHMTRLDMSGGEISHNRGNAGTGIYIENGNVTMSGGSVHDNKTVNNGTVDTPNGLQYLSFCPGAVYVAPGSGLTFNNKADVSANTGAITGGGICIAKNAKFEMDGGTVSGNKAVKTGGGIYCFSSDAYFNAGLVSGNKADKGGGIYTEGNDLDPSAAGAVYSAPRFRNTLITENDAELMGGGLWGCPTSRIVVEDYGAAIYGNTAGGGNLGAAGDDIAIETADPEREVEKNIAGISVAGTAEYLKNAHCVSEKTMFGNAGFYKDGEVKLIEMSTIPFAQVSADAPRYSEENATPEHIDGGVKTPHATKTILSDSVKSAAENSDRSGMLVVTGNHASRGGGIGTNGGVIIEKGTSPDNPPEPQTEKTQVSVKKVWKGDEAKDRPESISVQLMRDGKAYGEAVSLSEENGWEHTWTELDKDHEWSVEEIAVPEGYNSVTSHDGNSWIITNTKTEPEKPGGDNPKPVTPDEPNEPAKPSGGSGRTIDKTSHGTEIRTPGGYYVVRTGDTKEALIYTGLFAAAAAGAVYVSIRRRKKTSEK